MYVFMTLSHPLNSTTACDSERSSNQSIPCVRTLALWRRKPSSVLRHKTDRQSIVGKGTLSLRWLEVCVATNAGIERGLSTDCGVDGR